MALLAAPAAILLRPRQQACQAAAVFKFTSASTALWRAEEGSQVHGIVQVVSPGEYIINFAVSHHVENFR